MKNKITPKKISLPKNLGMIGVYLILTLLFAIPFIRAELIKRAYGEVSSCAKCIYMGALGNDTLLAGIGVLLIALSIYKKFKKIQKILLFLAYLIGLIQLTDTLITHLFGTRLYISDIVKFGGEGSSTRDYLTVLIKGGDPTIPFAAIILLLSFIFLFLKIKDNSKIALVLLIISFSMITGGFLLGKSGENYVHKEALVNTFQLQKLRSINTRYSENFINEILSKKINETEICEIGQGRTPNIILVIVESLSAYHSGLYGSDSYIPLLDDIAKKNTWFSNFHANGFMTDHALISLLNGQLPIPAIGQYLSLQAFDNYGNSPESVTDALKSSSYETAFFTTGTLDFLDKTSWLRRMRIDHIEGSEHIFYKDMPRGAFNAANDAALYSRFLQWFNERTSEKPFFATLLTVESHPPFFDKTTGSLDERAVFKNIDRSISNFYENLLKSGFLEDNILIIVGDHRSMTVVTKTEKDRLGEETLSRVPMIIAGASNLPKGIITMPFQQLDLIPSLKNLTSQGKLCRNINEGNFLRNDLKSPKYITHIRGDIRSRIDIYGAKEKTYIELSGDQSKIHGDTSSEIKDIETNIHKKRITRGETTQNMIDLLSKIQISKREKNEIDYSTNKK